MNLKLTSVPRGFAAVAVHPRRACAAVLLSLLSVALSVSPAVAQTITSAVPGLIAYQGKVTNAAGTVVGAGTPVNRLVIFRIWGHQSNSTAADLLYSEQQTVTISEGEFSVLIGQGTAVSGTPLGYSEAAKGPPSVTVASAAVFGGATRYLGVTIDDGTAAADPEVSPRQQMVTSAFAMRAKYAESVGSNGNNQLYVTDAGNIGIGNASPGFPLNFAATLGDKISLYGSAGAHYGFGVQSSNLQIHGSAATDDITFGYGLSSSMTETMRIKGNGNVGIGTNSPSAKLDVNGSLNVFDGGVKGFAGGLVSEGGATMVSFGLNDTRFGTPQNNTSQGGFLRLNTLGGTSNLFQFFARAKDGTSVSEVVSITGSGNVGIGNTSPTAKLHVNGSITSTSLSTGSLSLSGPLQASGAVATHTQGAYLEWNKDSFNGMTYLLNQRGTGQGGQVFGEIDSANAITENMRITAAGNVGIGTASPSGKLHVAGNIKIDSANVLEFGAGVSGKEANAGKIGYTAFSNTTGAEALDIVGVGSGTNPRIVRIWDKLGIGTASPTAILHVNGSGTDTIGAHTSFIGTSGTGSTVTGTSYTLSDVSIKGSGAVHALFFRATSDARIKNIVGRSDGARDLALLNQIEITDYTFRDPTQKGTRQQKKVIGQQVEAIFPQAVSRTTDFVPDVYRKAVAKDGWIALATDLKVGERVRLVSPKSDSTYEVLEVQPNRFRTAFTESLDDLFVYGREVSDFRVVDYEAIAMLNVSATQEIKREKDAEVAALRAQNDALTRRVAELEAKDRARDAKLASIEKLLQANQTVMASPAKTTNSNGQE